MEHWGFTKPPNSWENRWLFASRAGKTTLLSSAQIYHCCSQAVVENSRTTISSITNHRGLTRTCYKPDKHTIHIICVCMDKHQETEQEEKPMLIYLANQKPAGAKKSINAEQMCLYKNAFMLLFVYCFRTGKQLAWLEQRGSGIQPALKSQNCCS